MDEHIIIGEDGTVTAVATDVNIFEYVKVIGGTVVRRDEYVAPPYVPSVEELAAAEAEWRSAEMARVQENITALECGETDIPGGPGEWKAYYLGLRKWSVNASGFPDIDKRPVAPDA